MDTMKIHALLLLGIVAAGAMTIGNAYAQTNTERLMQVVSDTSSIMDTLDSIQATMAAALSSMADQMASIAAMVSGVDEKVDDIGSDVSHVADDVEHLIEDVEMLDSKIAEMMAANEASAAAQAEQVAQSAMVLPQMQATLDSIASSTAALASAEAVAQNTAAISEITQSIGEINAKLDAISTSLNVVQEVVEMPPPPEPSDAEALSPANLQAKTSPFPFMAGTFGDSVLKVPSADDDLAVTALSTSVNYGDRKAMTVTYEAAVSFTCTGNVYITSVQIADNTVLSYTVPTDANSSADIIKNYLVDANSSRYTTTSNAADASSFGEVESVTIVNPPRDVYYRNFNLQHGPGLYMEDKELHRTLDMNYYSLEAGQSLDVKAVYREFTKTITGSATEATDITPGMLYDENDDNDATETPITVRPVSLYTMISDFSNATRSAAGAMDIMTLNVGWTTSDSDTKCKFTVTSDAQREMVSKTGFYSMLPVSDDGITKTFKNMISCNDQKTTITGITVSAPRLDLYAYASYKASTNMVGASDDDKTEVTSWMFNATGSHVADSEAFPFDLMKGYELIFEGAVPDVDKLLVRISYDTVKGNECTLQ